MSILLRSGRYAGNSMYQHGLLDSLSIFTLGTLAFNVNLDLQGFALLHTSNAVR